MPPVKSFGERIADALGGLAHPDRIGRDVQRAAELAQVPVMEAEARKACLHHVQQLLHRFTLRHGTTECVELLGADWNTPEGLRRIQEENLVRARCPAFVRDAASILEELMTDSAAPSG